MQDVEARTIRKVSARLILFLIVCYFVAYLDRVNVGFAALTMNKALGLTATMYGFGAGVFFLTYFVFELPSNLALDRFGARKWIARIMVSWGLLSGLTAFIPAIARATGLSNETTFYTIRALLGFAEAGFFPGIIYFLTLWFPSAYRGRIIGSFMAAIPLSSVIGAPVSGMILGMDGVGGLDGWQWLFIIEATPAVLLGCVTYFYLTDRPADAHWLAADERAWLSRPSRGRAPAARGGARPFGRSGHRQSSRLGAGIRLFRTGGLQLRRRLLAAADHQGLRPVECHDRLGHGHPLRRPAPCSWSGTAVARMPKASARVMPRSRWRSRPPASPLPR